MTFDHEMMLRGEGPSVRLGDAMERGPLVGRDDERRVLAESLAAAVSGSGRLVLAGGEAGIGKPTLLEALDADARERGIAVLIGRCYDLSVDAPYSLWVDLGQSLPSDDTVPAFPLANRQTVADVAVSSQHTHFQDLARFFEQFASRGPCVVLLEDLHWADADSLVALRVLARRLRDLPALVVATYRSDELTRRHSLHQLVPQLVREARAERGTIHVVDSSR